MANLSALLTLALVLCSLLMCAARPEPAFPSTSPADKLHQAINLIHEKIEGNLVDDVEEERCDVEDEDCLMRRTLAAHLDYIYTQKKHP